LNNSSGNVLNCAPAAGNNGGEQRTDGFDLIMQDGQRANDFLSSLPLQSETAEQHNGNTIAENNHRIEKVLSSPTSLGGKMTRMKNNDEALNLEQSSYTSEPE